MAAAVLESTEQARSLGVFGVPWYVVDGESYWGQDRLDFVDRALSRQSSLR
jgi:2-hydroxychromene-2-carboxylate isomerase